MRRGWFVVPLLSLLALVPHGSARAHADLAGSSPEQGAGVTEPVGSVTLTFTEAVEPTSVGYRVARPDGGVVEPVASSADGVTWALTFEPVTTGVVTVSYDVISVDGHAIVGELVFTVDAARESPATAAVATAPTATAPTATAAAPTVTTASAPAVTAAPADADDDGSSPVLWAIVLVGGAVLIGVVAWTAVRRNQP